MKQNFWNWLECFKVFQLHSAQCVVTGCSIEIDYQVHKSMSVSMMCAIGSLTIIFCVTMVRTMYWWLLLHHQIILTCVSNQKINKSNEFWREENIRKWEKQEKWSLENRYYCSASTYFTEFGRRELLTE